MRRRGSSSAVLLVGAVLLGVWPAACDKKQQLTEVQVPDEGVALVYDLTPGQTYDGNVHMRNSIQTPMGEVVNILEFEVKLLVSGIGNDESRLVVATFDDIGFDLRLPDGFPAAAAGGMNAETAAALNGMELRFKLGRHGDVSELPDPPSDQPPPVQQMIQALTGAIAASLSRVPAKSVKDGDTWDAAATETQEGMQSSGTGTFVGMARAEGSSEDLAKLQLKGTSSGTVEAQGQKIEIRAEQEAEVLFSTTAGFPVHIERKRRSDGTVSAYTEITADWKKGGKEAVDIVPETQVQEITDPCDPDYVGPDACEEEAGDAEPAAEKAEDGEVEAAEAEAPQTEAADAKKKKDKK
jgi:hypothetical protein